MVPKSKMKKSEILELVFLSRSTCNLSFFSIGKKNIESLMLCNLYLPYRLSGINNTV